jgi:hypothetical protein
MNLKNKSYMQATEFKERQGFFSFFCEQAFEFLVKFQNACMTGWKNLFKPTEPEALNKSLPLPFGLFVVSNTQLRRST